MKMHDANTDLIINEIRNLSGRISKLPTKADVKVAVIEGIQEHEDRCLGRQAAPQVAENTGIIKTLTGSVRRSMAPAARTMGRIPVWARIVIGILSTSGVGVAIAATLQ